MPQQAKRSLSFWEIAKSSDYKASTQQTMQSLQSEEPPKSIDTFRLSGDRTSDAESALARLHCMLPTPIIK